MSGQILRAKLYIPRPGPNVVPRPHLIEQLNRGMAGKLTLLSAPAGFGKSTMLAAWAQQAAPARRVAWLSLDEVDNDPARFWAYVIAALQSVEPALGQTTLSLLNAPQPPPAEAALTPLLNELAALPAGLALALDDFHLIETRSIHAALAFLIEHLPPQLHLLIATRADPPLPLARLRARGQLAELRAAGLRFSAAETAALLNDTLALNLSPAEIGALSARTEGWIAGLQLAASSMRGRDDAADFIRAFTGSHRHILDYLVEEVLRRQPETVQTFLLRTAILNRLCGPLCNAVTGRGDGQATLEALEQANLFLIPLDDERRWYRYHRLFADLLRHRLHLSAAGEPDMPAELHRRAAAWFEQHGPITEAVHHAAAAPDMALAARLVEEHGLPMLEQGGLTTVLNWLNLLPGDVVRARPWLSVFFGWALLLTGQIEAVAPRLHDAQTAAATIEQPAPVMGHIEAIQAYLAALGGDIPACIELSQQALAHLPPADRSTRSVVAFTLGGATLMSGDIAGAARAFAEAGELGQAAGNMHVAVPALSALADMQTAQGRLHQAEQTCRRALELVPAPAPVAAAPHSTLAELYYEWNNLPRAAEHLSAALELGKLWGNLDSLVSSYLSLIKLERAQGNMPATGALWAEVDSRTLNHALVPPTESLLAAHRMQHVLAEGNIAAAAQLAAHRGLSAAGEVAHFRGMEYLAFGRVLLAQGQPAAAAALLERAQNAAETGHRTGELVKMLAVRAVALHAQGQMTTAVELLSRALALAEPEGYVRAFVDAGAAAANLLARLPQTPYRDKLLAAFETPPAGAAPASAPSPLIEPLSERELEVLRLIAAGLPNRKIAAELVVTTGTVKAHTASIYRKLDVHSRTQAVARARELLVL